MSPVSLMVRVLTGLTLLLFANINHREPWDIQRSSLSRNTDLEVEEDQDSYGTNTTSKGSRCSFREYPSQQYYNGAFLLQNSTTTINATRIKGEEEDVAIPHFIRQAKYLYGQLPIRLTDASTSHGGSSAASLGGKICDPQDHSQSSPLRESGDVDSLLQFEHNLLFSDGTNPSILSISRIKRHLSPNHPLLQFIELYHKEDAFFVGTILFKRPEAMQCYYQDDTRQISLDDAFRGYQRGTWLILMNSHGHILWKTLIPLTKALQEAQAENYRVEDESSVQQTNDTATAASSIASVHNLHNRALQTHDVLDDPRLFLHNGNLWINYKSGRFVNHNPIHFHAVEDFSSFTSKSTPTFTVSLRDEETIPVCCGRNMGVLEQRPNTTSFKTNESLLSLVTWVDPVTVQHFNDTNGMSPVHQSMARRKDRRGRRLVGSRKNNTRLHGTTGFLLYLPDTQEYLGVGHFHKGYDRPYAVWGHHYTHVFYTIAARSVSEATNEEPHLPPEYRLSRLSPEFVLGAQSPNHPKDGEVIQFAPGLEIVQLPFGDAHHMHDNTTTATMKDYLVLSYGINDCESAIQYIDLDRVLQDLLRPVPVGLETVDELMMEASFRNDIQ